MVTVWGSVTGHRLSVVEEGRAAARAAERLSGLGESRPRRKVADSQPGEPPATSPRRAVRTPALAWLEMSKNDVASEQPTPRFQGVLLDWRGTLVTAPRYDLWVKTALQRIRRDAGAQAVDAVLTLLRSADRSVVDSGIIDIDVALHRTAYYSWFAAAGVDALLADSLYAVECDASMNPFADDVELLLTTLHGAGTRIGIVSDIHFDLRPSFAERETEYGTKWIDLVDAWIGSTVSWTWSHLDGHLPSAVCGVTAWHRLRPSQ